MSCPPKPHPLAPSPTALPSDRERGNDEEAAVPESKGPPSPSGRGTEGEVSEGTRSQEPRTPYSPKGYVSGVPDTSCAPSGVTARVSSNQTYSSNCQGSTAWK